MEVNMLAIYIIFGLMIVLGLVALLISLLPGGVGSVRSRGSRG